MKVLVTGATGFVGRALLRHLAASEGFALRALVRRQPEDAVPGCEYVVGPDLGDGELPTGLAQGCDAVVHAAARVHVMRETAADPLALYRQVNVRGTRALAEAAAAAGVRRFVLLSTVKVYGEQSAPGHPWREHDPTATSDPYAVSKLEAEAALRAACAAAGMEYTVVRLPLVYGPGVRANFLALADAIARGVPLPLGAVRNRRSMLALANLVDFLTVCLSHPAAANEVFNVADATPLSTADLARGLAQALGRPPRLVPVPAWALRSALRLTGRGDTAARLLGDLEIDTGKARKRLGWQPPVSIEQGLREAVEGLGKP